MAAKSSTVPPAGKRPLDPFRRAVLRGLAVLLPPLLTIVIFLWVGSTVITYMLEPLENGSRWLLMEYATDIQPSNAKATPVYESDEEPVDTQRTDPKDEANAGETDAQTKPDKPPVPKRGDAQPAYYMIDGKPYVRTADERYVPLTVQQEVQHRVTRRSSAEEIYREYFNRTWLDRRFVIPVFLGVFILVLYLLGKFLAAGVGRFLWAQFESLIKRLPLVSNVYSSVKQVTDFMFTEPHLQATRVVAIEYPRRGIWTLAMVTGESMLDIRAAANEPVLSVLVPTSPMPFTGFTMTVRKSETIDLNITMDQALQFIVSCGVVVPPHQLATDVDDRDRILSADSAHSMPPPMRTKPEE